MCAGVMMNGFFLPSFCYAMVRLLGFYIARLLSSHRLYVVSEWRPIRLVFHLFYVSPTLFISGGFSFYIVWCIYALIFHAPIAGAAVVVPTLTSRALAEPTCHYIN